MKKKIWTAFDVSSLKNEQQEQSKQEKQAKTMGKICWNSITCSKLKKTFPDRFRTIDFVFIGRCVTTLPPAQINVWLLVLSKPKVKLFD